VQTLAGIEAGVKAEERGGAGRKPDWHFLSGICQRRAGKIAVNTPNFSVTTMNGNWRGRRRGPSTRAFA
ncbi:hypothetical protein, partial [Escherichia coli]|uniref:hypothetical protein n=2 Tax=Escherichia coli TaxID=562 RepID=UPI002284113C